MSTDVTDVIAIDVFAIDVITAARLLGVAVPLIVALITKRWASARVKALANIVLAAVFGAIAPVLAGNGGPDSIAELFNLIINTFVTGIVAYYGLLKPTGITAALAGATANVGLGAQDPAKASAGDGRPDGSA